LDAPSSGFGHKETFASKHPPPKFLTNVFFGLRTLPSKKQKIWGKAFDVGQKKTLEPDVAACG